jgi:hypothetical protein
MAALTNGIPPLPRFDQGGPQSDTDWDQLYRWLVRVRSALLTPTVQGTQAVFAGTPASSYVPGTVFLITDSAPFRNLLYVQLAGNWQFVSGESFGTQSQLPVLGKFDAGYQYGVLDYNHLLQWSGIAWNFAPGDSGSGYMQLFEIDPTVAGWALYSGQAVNYLKSDGTLGIVTLPDLLASTVFLAGGALDSLILPAVSPLATGGGGAIADALTGLTIPANTGQDSGAGTAVGSGGGTTVASHPHTHTEGPVADPGHTHVFTPKQPLISATGMPQRIVRRPWFRV